MSLHITGMIWARPTSDLDPQSGEAFQPDHIAELTLAHEAGGFDRVLAGYWTNAADGFLVLAHAAAVAKKIGFLIAHRPGFVAPTLAARKLATLDQLTGGRLALHVISGGEDADQRKDGDYADHAARYRRTDEFLSVLRRTWTADAPFDHQGEFYRAQQVWSDIRPRQPGGIPIFFGGASPAAIGVAGRHADVYALFGEPLADTAGVLQRVREGAASGRDIAFSWSNRPIIAATEKQAWEKAHAIRERALAKQQTQGTAGIQAGQAVNSQRLVGLAQRGELLDERLWTAMAGVLGGRGNSTALVGTAEQVARAMLRYRKIGVSHYILRGWDPLPDAVQYGAELIPLLRELAAAEDVGRVSVAAA
ncbi:alkanesulfonate monooxygenase [Pseudoroseomonas deserti]|uniref:Alkanesulfonate monooxygenase n=1 Tax=Teichococcus deserti TaxID=1817963 RepID=A0A1V2H1Y1_9PROT|nr:LLM class flavin-dependent oxidoreductase [Pseudoroseomonas deserti]ONG53232.1 alkanesulfonate monooxygenase [Pseudoroseomonas deserti]